MKKCNSHLDEVSLKFSPQPWYVTLGNERADALAQRGLEKALNLIQPEVDSLKDYEALLQRVHKRLAAVASAVNSLPRVQHQRPRVANSKIRAKPVKIVALRQELERVTGHCMQQHPKDKKRWFCFHCKLGPTREAVETWMQQHPCKGRAFVSPFNVPLPIPTSAYPSLIVGGKTIHSSHSVQIMNGQIWCMKCARLGSCTSTGGGKLHQLPVPCPGGVGTDSGRDVLRRLANCQPPNASAKTWPSGDPIRPLKACKVKQARPM